MRCGWPPRGAAGPRRWRSTGAHRPDVLLMDIRMAGMTGLEAGESLLREFPDARILFLTTFSDDEYIVRALRMGAKGYLIKQDFESILPRAAGGARGTERVRRRGDGTASGADAERGRIRLRSSGAERAGAGRHRAGGQGVQQQGDCRRAVPQRGNGAQLSQRGSSTSSNCGIAPSWRCFITTTRPGEGMKGGRPLAAPTNKKLPPSAIRADSGGFFYLFTGLLSVLPTR